MISTQEIRKLLEEDKLIFGLKETQRKLADKNVSKVLIAENAALESKEQMLRQAELSGIESEVLEIRNEQLGNICRRPHPISFIGITK